MDMGALVVFRAEGDKLNPLPVEASSLDEATMQTGHGVYTVFRLYHDCRVLRFGHHMKRLRQSAAELGQPFRHAESWLRGMTRRAVEESGIDMPRVRLVIPFDDPDALIITLEPFAPPPAAVYTRGVSVGLAEAPRARPEAKDSRFIEERRGILRAQPGMYEVLLCEPDGRLLEGTSSNFYAVLDGELRTAGSGMLSGIARSVLLEVAPSVLPVALRAVQVVDLPRVSEAMLTSSSRGVVPVVWVGEDRIGDGRPGPLTARLGAAYDAQVEAELEPL
jgi:branched-chain amino acid aminotransferase